jgi:glycosyltransferase involved in cell wall biosynthesis
MRILFITLYPIEGPSSRFRVWQYVPRLLALGHDVEVAPFFGSGDYPKLYQPGAWLWKTLVVARGFWRRLALLSSVRRADVVVIHRAAAPIGPPLLERLYHRLNRRLVFDFDDAIFMPQTIAAHRRFVFLKSSEKTATLIRMSRRVLAGNGFLAEYARRFHADVHVLPTVVALPSKPRVRRSSGPVVIGWIGSPTTAPFLEEIADALSEVKARYGSAVEVRIVGAGEYRLPDLEATYRPWSLDRETDELCGFDIGLMPLPDTDWARGKCGLKALQYMSVGVPVVCSPVGVNSEIVEDGASGFLPKSTAEWVQAIARLVEDAGLRQKMGEVGRHRVSQHYSLDRWAPQLAEHLREVGESSGSHEKTPRNVKIVRVLTRMNIGGPTIHAVLLTAGLNGGRFRSVLVAGEVQPEEGDMSDLANAHGVPLLRIPGLGRSIRLRDDVRALWRLYCLLRRERPDVLHTHMAKAGTLARFAGWLAGVPVRVHTYHGHVLDGYFSPLQSRLAALAERMLARLSSAVVVVSPAVRHDLVERFHIAPSEKTVVVSLGFDLSPYLSSHRKDAILRRSLGLAADTPLVGIVGRMVPVKNHALFLEAAREVHRHRPQVHFVLVGGGELQPELRRLAEQLGLREVVHFVGWQRQMERVYPDLDALVLTSKNEGTPVVLIEAMACGVPVVATRVGGVPDVVEHGRTGLLVPANDVEGVASAVLDLLEDRRQAQRLGRAGRESVRERFSVQRLLRDTEALYERLLMQSLARR